MSDHTELMDIDTLHQMLLNIDARINATQGSSHRGNGRNTCGGGRFSQRSNRNHVGGRFSTSIRDIECQYCHRKGHYARDCYQKQRDNNQTELHAIQHPFASQNQATQGFSNGYGIPGNPLIENQVNNLPPQPQQNNHSKN